MSTRYYEREIDVSSFSPIPRKDNHRSAMAINTTETGFVTLNAELLKNVKTRALDIRANSDYRMLIMFDNKPGDISFPKNGRVKNLNFIKELKKHRIPLPARYEFSYSEKQAVWVGELVESNNRLSKIKKEINMTSAINNSKNM